MKAFGRFATLTCVLVLTFAGTAQTQETVSATAASSASGAQPGSEITVPRLVRFSGVLKDSTGAIPNGTVSLTFSLYQLPEGGTPLWTEAQKVQLDEQGRYGALLGATQPDGLPLEVFTSGKALWLGVQPQLPRVGEQSRVLLVAVPYALKAADADTLGGKPASAYVTTETLSIPALAASAASSAAGVGTAAQTPSAPQTRSAASDTSAAASACASITADGTAKANFVAKFTAACQIHQSSVLSENGGTLGVAGVLQLPPAGAATKTLGTNSQPVDLLASSFSSTFSIPTNQRFRWQAEPVGNNSPSPSAKLNLLFGVGNNTPGETGLSISNTGIVTFASGQTFPGGTVKGNETVQGNLTATGQLISTEKTGTAPLSVTSQTQVPNLNASLLGGKPASAFATLGSNKFVGNQSVTGNIVATVNPLVGGEAVLGISNTQSPGVQGDNRSGDVFSTGVYGSNEFASKGIGVEGFASGTDPIGVGGSTNLGGTNDFGTVANSIMGTAAIGVIGDSEGYAVVAASDSSNALLVENGSSNNADTAVINNLGSGAPLFASGKGGSLFFDASGNLTISGTYFGGSKSFKIDHPLDPANKYLYHASVESSEMMNIYSGTVLLDPSGSATVSLPDSFEAVNGDFRYQLTAIGAPAPNLHIAREVSNNQFTIAGGQPGMKVSWQVTGVRHDAYAQAHPLQVSVDKPEEERGYYIHPELYGAPPEKNLASAHMAQVTHRVRQN